MFPSRPKNARKRKGWDGAPTAYIRDGGGNEKKTSEERSAQGRRTSPRFLRRNLDEDRVLDSLPSGPSRRDSTATPRAKQMATTMKTSNATSAAAGHPGGADDRND